MQNLAQPYVAADFHRLRAAIVMAPGAHAASLPVLQAEPGVVAERALEAHAVLRRRLRDMGITLEVLPAGNHGLSFAAADLAVVVERGAIMMRPSQLERRADVAALEAKFTELGIPVIGRIEAPGLLDGGDILLGEGIAYVGIPQGAGQFAHRGNAAGRAAFAQISGLRVVEVPVAARNARLNSVATLLDASTVILGGNDVDQAAFDGLAKIVTPIGEELGAGMFVLDKKHVIANIRFRETPALLKKARITVDGLDVWEFGKVGFMPSSLILAVSRR